MPAGYNLNANRTPPDAGPGRPKGSPNKIGKQAKENVVAVFEKVGGIESMVKWARRNKTEFYRLYARLIPTYVSASVDVRHVREYTDDELAGIIAGASSQRAAIEAPSETVINEFH